MDLLTDKEVAAIIGKSAATVKRLRLAGELPFLAGRPPRVRRTDVDKYLDREIKLHKKARPTRRSQFKR